MLTHVLIDISTQEQNSIFCTNIYVSFNGPIFFICVFFYFVRSSKGIHFPGHFARGPALSVPGVGHSQFYRGPGSGH